MSGRTAGGVSRPGTRPSAWGLRARLSAAASVLIVLSCASLSWILAHKNFAEISRSTADRGRTIASYIATAAELSVLSGDTRSLEQLALVAREQPDVVYCRFFDRDGYLLASVGEPPPEVASFVKHSETDSTEPALVTPALWEILSPVRTTDHRQLREELEFWTEPAGVPEIHIGTVAIGMSLDSLQALRRRVFVTAATVTGLVTFIGIAGIALLATAITGPLRALAAATERIARGEWNTVKVTSRDEIGALASSFNEMVQSLSRNRVALEERSRSLHLRTEELERLNRDLEHANAAANAANRAKSEFLANMSHEIRTPLNIIFGYETLIEEHLVENGDAEARDLVGPVRRAGQRLMETIDSILDISKMESGTFDLKPAPLPLAPLLKRQVEELGVLAQQKGIGFSLALEEAGVVVLFDEYCLSHAVMNLMQNAIKFTERGEVAVRLFRNGDERLRLEVRDTGIGMAATYLPNLFKPFSQEDCGYTRRYEGTGLGLALTKRFLELNGATISVESEKDSGSIFTIAFAKESEISSIPAEPSDSGRGQPDPLLTDPLLTLTAGAGAR